MITIKMGFDRKRECKKENFKFLCGIEEITKSLPNIGHTPDVKINPDVKEYDRTRKNEFEYSKESESLDQSSILFDFDTDFQNDKKNNIDVWTLDLNSFSMMERNEILSDVTIDKAQTSHHISSLHSLVHSQDVLERKKPRNNTVLRNKRKNGFAKTNRFSKNAHSIERSSLNCLSRNMRKSLGLCTNRYNKYKCISHRTFYGIYKNCRSNKI